MPSAPPSALNLDISCLRHLISRHHTLSQLVLPSASTLSKYQRALSRIHGPADHARLIAMQALLTAMSTIFSSLFDCGPSDQHDLLTVIRMVHYVIALELDDSLFTPSVQSSLLIAYAHAVIRWFPSVPQEQRSSRYRSVLDLLRSPAWNSRLDIIQQFGITEFKSVVSTVCKLPQEQVLARSSPDRFAANFEIHYPLRKLRTAFQRHINAISHQLPTLHVSVGRRQPVQNHDRTDHVAGVPDFFSDAEYTNAKDAGIEGRFSPMQSDEEASSDAQIEKSPVQSKPGSARRGRKVSGRHRRFVRSSKASAARSPEQKLTPKSLRRREEVDALGESDEEEEDDERDEDDEAEEEMEAEEEGDEHHGEYNGDAQRHGDDELQPETLGNDNDYNGVDNRGTGHRVSPADLREIDQLASDAFYGSDDLSQVTHLARRQRSRRASAKRRRSTGEKIHPVIRDDAERNDAVNYAEESSEPKDMEENESEDNIAQVNGPDGEPLRQLQDAASNLSRRTRLSDPLSRSLREARGARRNLRKTSSRFYSPAPDARSASPIPDSGTPVSRKRTRKFNLDDDSDDFARNGRRVRRRRSPPKFYGKTIKTGRFQVFEDEQLKAGLSKYGWGAWTDIAKNLWTGEYTRAPMSLKDRARTLDLKPRMYPDPAHRRGRPRVHNEQKQKDISDEQIEDDGE